MSGVDSETGTMNDGLNLSFSRIRKGAVDSVFKLTELKSMPREIEMAIKKIAESGGTPLLVSGDEQILGVIHLKDVVKAGIKEKFKELRMMGIKTIMITGDNPLTAGAIAAEAGVDDYIAEATPEDKLKKIRSEQEKGYLVAMTGDGTNDAPALAQADVGVAMNTGTQAAREAGNMVDLDSDPTKLINVVEVGKQLLITRGALTTFSFANDIAKYFAILPAIFSSLYLVNHHGALARFNIMHLASPQSAILSAVIFNALIIVFLTPLALKGVPFSNLSTDQLLKKNIFIYGLGGVLLPFFGIKLIDIFIVWAGVVA
jgi:K+-transporting ATPase ATPase B chain